VSWKRIKWWAIVQLSHNLCFPVISSIFPGLFNFTIFVMYYLPWFYVSEISDFPDLRLENLQREQFWHKMVSAKRLFLATCFVTYICCQLFVTHPTKTNVYIALQNESGVSCLTVMENKRLLTMPHVERNHKWHSLQAGILKNCHELCKIILCYSTFSCFNNFTMWLVL
jgi:hypothetical protein